MTAQPTGPENSLRETPKPIEIKRCGSCPEKCEFRKLKGYCLLTKEYYSYRIHPFTLDQATVFEFTNQYAAMTNGAPIQ